MNKKAFTLIELIIVIAIIAILAALSFVAVNPGKRIGQAQDDERLTEARSIQEAINKYTADNLALPPSIASIEDYIPYMITNLNILDLLDCPEVLGGIEEVNIGTELASYLPILPIDPKEEDPDSNGTGYYLRKENNVIEVKPCDLYANEDIPSDGLILAMRMDEDPSGPIPNYSGGPDTGAAQGGMDSNDIVSGQVGGALEFDGDDDSLNVYLNFQEIDTANSYTFSLWKKKYEVGNDSSARRTMLALRNASNNNQGSAYLSLEQWEGGDFVVFIGNGSSNETPIAGFTHQNSPTIWSHIVLVIDGSNIKLYENGNYNGTGINTSYTYNSVANIVLIGSRTNQFWKTNIDEVAIWDRELSEEEILAIYNLQK